MAMALMKCMLVCIGALLFNGCQAAGPILADLWINIPTPDNPPTPRYSHSAVFNPVYGNMIMFGGNSGDDAGLNDISIYNLESNMWDLTVEVSGIAPLPRYGHSAVVTGLNTMVVFGGRNGSDVYNDVAVFDMASLTWLNITVSGSPPARAYHTAVVDRYQHVMYIYGGTTNGADFMSDMYMLDLDQFVWSSLNTTDAATPRAMHSAIMTLQGVMIVFGGIGLSDVACFDVRNHTWYQCLTDSSPAPTVRYGHTAVYSPLQQMVIYGGKNDAGNPVNDVWNFDLNLFLWHTVITGGLAINPRSLHSAVATTFGTMVVVGGIDGDGVITNDFGLYNLANTVLHSANDGIVLVVLVTLMGTILLALCFAMDYMQEQNAIDKSEAIARAKTEQLLLPNFPTIPKSLHIPLGPRAQKFLDEFKMSLDPMQDPK